MFYILKYITIYLYIFLIAVVLGCIILASAGLLSVFELYTYCHVTTRATNT